ncbi:MAG: hypothetical protein GY928_30490, partial [Colwellia sp.]|nr:hypothetical protein [Colwellia sp.]
NIILGGNPPIPRNVSQRFDFKDGISDYTASLAICDASKPSDEEIFNENNCPHSNDRLGWSKNYFTNQARMSLKADLSPDNPQVYQIRHPITSNSFDGLSLDMHIPSHENLTPFSVRFCFLPEDGETWACSEQLIQDFGWHRFFLDMHRQTYIDEKLLSDKRINFFHIDLWLPKVSGNTQSIEFLIDDIEFYSVLPE